jgi:hypothetical protein
LIIYYISLYASFLGEVGAGDIEAMMFSLISREEIMTLRLFP